MGQKALISVVKIAQFPKLHLAKMNAPDRDPGYCDSNGA
jgi:hypothetical protein